MAATLRTHPESLKQRFLETLQDVTDGALRSFLLVRDIGQFCATLFRTGTAVMLSSSGTTDVSSDCKIRTRTETPPFGPLGPVRPPMPASALETFALLTLRGGLAVVVFHGAIVECRRVCPIAPAGIRDEEPGAAASPLHARPTGRVDALSWPAPVPCSVREHRPRGDRCTPRGWPSHRRGRPAELPKPTGPRWLRS